MVAVPATLQAMTEELDREDRRARPGLVVGWMPASQRSRTLAARLGFDLLLLGRPGFRRPWSAPLSYPLLAARTLGALLRRRPGSVVVVVPPVFAPLAVLPVARLLSARVAVDVHSGALLDRRWRWSLPLLRWAIRRADVCLVTVDALAGSLPRTTPLIVLPDPLPDMAAAPVAHKAGRNAPALIVAVCGWGDDEPVEALVQAAAGAPWHLKVTGRMRRIVPAPGNVEFTGFLADDVYASLLARADAVVVLTTREDTLLSGAWEAIALARPLVLSGTHSLRAAFGDGVTYAGNDAPSIRAACDAVLDDPAADARAAQLRAAWAHRTDEGLAELKRRLRIGRIE